MNFRLSFALTSMCIFLPAMVSVRADELPKSPNIILFLADDQGWTGTSVVMDRRRDDSRSDFYQTPSLERLAREGMRFSQGYAPHPNCSSTRMSIQTGKSPARLGSTDIYDVVTATRGYGRAFYNRFYVNKPMKVPLPIAGLPEEEITIAEFIKKNRPEYATAHLGKWHMNGGDPSKHGYDQHDGLTSNAEGNTREPDPKLIGSITNRSIKFIENCTAQKQPFFLQVSHYAVHTPVFARPATLEKYDSADRGRVHTNAAYAAMTQDLDQSLGRLLTTLDELELTDNTYIIYTSDNGGEIGAGDTPTVNTPLKKGKTHTWEGGIRVPLIVRGPGVQRDSQSDVPIIGWDFFPTIAEMLTIDAPLPQDMDGGSFNSILQNQGRGKVDRPTDSFVWYYPHYRDNKGVRPQAAIRSGQFKLRKEYETEKLMLFDLGQDISEKNDLSQKMPEVTKRLHESLENYLTAAGAERPVLDPNYDPEKDLGRQPPRGPRRRPGGPGN